MGADHQHPRSQTPSERAALGGDVASQALNEALRVSFRILKFAMLLVIVLFLFSGVFTVGQHEQAFVLRFGRLVTDREGKGVLGPGLHFAWPFLVDEVVRFPVMRDLSLPLDSFWHEEQPRELGRRTPPGLAPDRGGYNLTGDVNILHSRWTVTYSIADPVKFFEKLGDPADLAPGKNAGPVKKLLRALFNSIVIRTIARYPVDDAYGGKREALSAEVEKALIAELDRLDVGVRINDVILEVITPPVQTKKAFDDVTNAREERGKLVAAAEGYRAKTEREAEGEAARVVAEAMAYKTRIVAQAKADASYMASLLKQYPDDRQMLNRVLRQRLIEVLTEALSEADEVYVVAPGAGGPQELRIYLNRDPQAMREVMKKRAEEEKEKQKKAKKGS